MINTVKNKKEALEYFSTFGGGPVDCIKGNKVKRVCCYMDAVVFFDFNQNRLVRVK